MPQLIDSGIFSAVTNAGAIGVGWKLNFYVVGTSTRLDTYPTEADATAAANPNSNPIVIPSDGRIPTFWLKDQDYKLILTDAADVVKNTVPVLPRVDGGRIGYLHSATATATTVQGALRRWIHADDYMSPAFTAAQNTTGWGKIVTLVGSDKATLQYGAGVYSIDTAMANPAGLAHRGMGSNATIINFTGATDGITIADGFRVLDIEGIQLRTANASGGKALFIQNGSSGYMSDVQITSTGSGRWAFGIWANGWQTSNFYGVRMANPSSVGGPSVTVGLHLEYGSNANQFYGLEVIGSSGAGTVQRAIELSSVNSLAATANDAFDVYFIGGTFQGYFTKSLLYTTNASPIMFGIHPENTNAAPTDGADFWLDGTTGGAIVNSKFVGFQGGSFGTTGTIRNMGIAHGEVGNITIGAACLAASLLDLRIGTLTDTGAQTSIIGVSDGTGTAIGSVIAAPTLRHKISGTTIWGSNVKGFGYSASQFATVTQATSKATGVTLNFVHGEITMDAAALAADTTVSFAFTNSNIEDNDYLLVQHVSGGTAGAYLVNALCAAGSATVNVRNITPGALSEAIVLGFTLIKGTIAA